MGAAAERDRRINFYLDKIEGIPSLPTIVMELITLVDNPMASVGQIEELMKKDQGLTLRALRIANSAFYSIPGGCTTLGRAITFLGCNTVKQLVVSAAVCDAFKDLKSEVFDIKEFWRHSVVTAIISQILAKHLDSVVADEVFICGLIHDIGKLALLMVDKEGLEKTYILAREQNLNSIQAEIEGNFPSHAHWGQVLAEKWQLPILIQSTIKDHHSSRHALRMSSDPEINFIVDLVLLANQLGHATGFGNSGYKVKLKFDREVMARVGLSEEDRDQWFQKIKEGIAHAEAFSKLLVSQ